MEVGSLIFGRSQDVERIFIPNRVGNGTKERKGYWEIRGIPK